jgi:hypothetical protein
MRLNVWQAEAIAAAMRAHDNAWTARPEAGGPGDNLQSAYAEVTLEDRDGERIVFVRFEDNGTVAIWHDGTDCTDEYPDDATKEASA